MTEKKRPESIVREIRRLGSLYAVHAAALFPGAAGLIIESGIADPLERSRRRVRRRSKIGTLPDMSHRWPERYRHAPSPPR